MGVLTGVLAILVVVAILFEIARRIGVPYPTLLVLGGLGLGLLPGLPHITLDPDLVLLVFLPPLLFSAAVQTPLRELRTNIAPIARLSIGLVIFTTVIVAAATQAAIPGLGWAAAFTLGTIVAPTDALAATTVFRRLGVPRQISTLIEGEALFNDGTALIAYRVAVVAAISGVFVVQDALAGLVVAAAGGVLMGAVVGRLVTEILDRVDDPPVEVAISLVIPYAAYLPADWLGLSGVLAAVSAGLVVGRRLGTILTPNSRVLWQGTWEMVDFVLNGLVFVLIGLELPHILRAVGSRPPAQVLGLVVLVCGTVVVTRLAWVYATSMLPGSPRRVIARRDPRLGTRLTFVVGWTGLRGAVSLAAALALPNAFPERNLILLLTFSVILVTLVGQGLTLPFVLRHVGWDGIEPGVDEAALARSVAYQSGLDEIKRVRPDWPTHHPLLDRLESGPRDRSRHLATDDPGETAGRRQELLEHEEIQCAVIAAQRLAVIELRDHGEINDQALREVERELDHEALRMERCARPVYGCGGRRPGRRRSMGDSDGGDACSGDRDQAAPYERIPSSFVRLSRRALIARRNALPAMLSAAISGRRMRPNVG